MKIYEDLKQFDRPKNGCILTAGNFDGLHNGHRAIIRRARAFADAHGMPLVAMTFKPLPLQVLAPDIAPKLITPLIMKRKLLGEMDIDALIVLDTTRGLLDIPAEQFLKDIMLGALNMKYIVEGSTFNFGHKAKGDIPGLIGWGADFGFGVELVQAHAEVIDGEKTDISSTLVRQLLQQSRFAAVKTALGRYYSLAGVIEPTRGRGHELGFPTANLQLYDKKQLIPGDGVFAGFVRWGDSFDAAWASADYHGAAVSIGPCSTFADGQWQIEAHILGFSGKRDILTGKHMLISLVEKLRGQEKFNDVDELVSKIKEDCRRTAKIIGDLDLKV
ncbi:MAG: bifunctional riboflavin kinase/FMN adenylyltransferase [Phycisphaerae bacterium]|nr:bifunctional riboflavin kinase/FMN adenylyltransferase [Phycisphaerae bacterium]